eukprot:1826994-Amphidinium_carterae.1
MFVQCLRLCWLQISGFQVIQYKKDMTSVCVRQQLCQPHNQWNQFLRDPFHVRLSRSSRTASLYLGCKPHMEGEQGGEPSCHLHISIGDEDGAGNM